MTPRTSAGLYGKPATLALFIDTNIPIYAIGREHRYKQPAGRILDLVAGNRGAFVTDSEVLQEIIHYYIARRRWEQGHVTLRQFAENMHSRIEPVYAEDVVLAGQMVNRYPGVDSQDLVHTAVMRRLGVTRIISADTDFDRIDGVERLDPAHLDEWEQSLQLP